LVSVRDGMWDVPTPATMAYHSFPQSFHLNVRIIFQIRPQLHASMSFPIHDSLIILQPDIIFNLEHWKHY
jgi:hypothetical protein